MMRNLISIITEAEQRICQTPGANYEIVVKSDELGGTVHLPPEVRLDMSDDDAEKAENKIHDALEDVVAKIIAEIDNDADEHWAKARENDSA